MTDQNKEEKTFTQEDVNNIVQERLAKERNKSGEDSGDKGIKESTDLEQREKDLRTRELKFKAKELIVEHKVPEEVLDLLKYEDEETLTNSITKISEVFRTKGRDKAQRFVDKVDSGGKPVIPNNDTGIRDAFGLGGLTNGYTISRQICTLYR